jgi:zinc protease
MENFGSPADRGGQQPPLRPPKLNITEHTLPNGLKVVLLEDHSAPVVNVQVWYHVGSKDEQPGRTGFAHLFEHLMFKGSAHVKPQEHAQRIQDVGGVMNAYTSFDQTVYWETVPSNALDLVLWLEAERMASLAVDEENLTSERDVVIEELRLRVENPPYGKLAQVVFSTAYKEHSYKWQPIGSKEDLRAAGLTDVMAFHSTYYVPNNATLVVVGDFDTADTVASITRYFEAIPHGKGEIPRPARSEPAQTAERRTIEYDSKAPLPAVISTYHIPGAGDPDSYPLEVASLILSGGESSRIYQRLVYDKQIALQAAGQSFTLEDPGLFFFFAVLNAGVAPETAEAEVAAEVARLRDEAVSAAELEKARTQLIAGLTIGRQSVQEKASAIGNAAVVLDNPNLVNDELARFQAVTAADVQRVARKYFTEENRSVIYMLPEAMRPEDNGGGT